MYFGDYLVQEKIIGEGQLIEALCYQLESMPSFIKLIYESKLINPNVLLEIIKKQIKNDSDVISVLLNGKYLTQDQVNELTQKQLSMRLPVGEALVKLGHLNEQHLTSYLQQYFSAKDSLGTQVDSSVDVNDAALESLRELGIDIGEMGQSKKSKVCDELTYFFNAFNEKTKNRLLKLIEMIESSQVKSQELSNYANSLFRDVHLLKGAIVFSEIKSIEHSITLIDRSLDHSLAQGEQGIQHWCRQHIALLKEYVQQLWRFRTEVEAYSSLDEIKENMPSVLFLNKCVIGLA